MPTSFQIAVYKALDKIPKGKVTTYAQISKFLGNNAVRAIGTAVGKNPNAPVCPCHRVVLSTGRIGEYSAGEGVETKIALLENEGIEIKHGKVLNFENVLFRF